jgi:hypothetical protein
MTERRARARHKVILPALCWNRGRADFYAVTEDVSPDGIHFRSALVPHVDEDLTCSIRHIGQVEGTVIRVSTQAFVIRVRARPKTAAGIARDLMHLARQQVPAAEPARVHPRVIPLKTDIAVQLACGRILRAKLLNVSASGAAVYLDEPIELGAPLRIGRTWARIARQFERGVGATFEVPLDPRDVSERIVL